MFRAWHGSPSLQIWTKPCRTFRWRTLSLEKAWIHSLSLLLPMALQLQGEPNTQHRPQLHGGLLLTVRQKPELLSPGVSIPAPWSGAKLRKKHVKPWICPRFAASRKPLQFQTSLTNQLWGKQLVWSKALKIDIIITNQGYNIYQLVHEFKSSF